MRLNGKKTAARWGSGPYQRYAAASAARAGVIYVAVIFFFYFSTKKTDHVTSKKSPN